MLVPKTRIPRIAVAGLVLGGAAAGCGSDDPLSNAELASGYCDAFLMCNPTEFATYYADAAECRTTARAEAEELLSGAAERSAACGRAARQALACENAAYAASCDDDMVTTQCASEFAAAAEACRDANVPSPAELAAAGCAATAQCDPDEFMSSWTSQADCVADQTTGLTEELDAYALAYGVTCRDAYAQLIDCYYEQLDATCDTEMPDWTVACALEYAAFEAECD